MVALSTGLDPIEIGGQWSKVKVIVNKHVFPNDENIANKKHSENEYTHTSRHQYKFDFDKHDLHRYINIIVILL